MARAPAKNNQVLAVAKAMLQTIDSVASPNTWLTKPRAVSLGITFGDWMGGPRPALYLEPAETEFQDRSTQHQRRLALKILCVCEGSIPGLTQLMDLEEDVIYAFIRQPSSEYAALQDGTRVEKFSVLNTDPAWDRRATSKLAVSLITVEARFVHGHTPATI